MLKHPNTFLAIPTAVFFGAGAPTCALLLSLFVVSGCERLPISIGDGFDGVLDGSDDPSGNAGTGSGGAGGGPETDPVSGGTSSTETDPVSGGTSSTGTGGAPSFDCENTYLACFESGEWPEACRDIYESCASAGTAGTGSGGAASDPVAGTGSGGAASDPVAGTGSGGASDPVAGTGTGGASDPVSGGGEPDPGAGAAGTGSGGGETDPGAGGYAGTGTGGSNGTSGRDECVTTYLLCFESGEDPALCRDELDRCGSSAGTGTGGAPGNG